MIIHIKDECQLCKRCEYYCPEVFLIDSPNSFFLIDIKYQNVEGNELKIIKAVEHCPYDCLTIDDESMAKWKHIQELTE